MTTAIKTQKVIEAAAIFRCYTKEDTHKEHCIGYGVPSDKEGTYYVTYNFKLHRYECTCMDHIQRRHNCKHINSVIETVEARKQVAVEVIEEIAAVEEVKAEAKLAAFKAGMEEQYASDPRVEMARQREVAENRSAYLKMMEAEY